MSADSGWGRAVGRSVLLGRQFLVDVSVDPISIGFCCWDSELLQLHGSAPRRNRLRISQGRDYADLSASGGFAQICAD